MGYRWHRTNIQLPLKKCDKLIEILQITVRQKRVSLKELQSIQEKLKFTFIAIPLEKSLLGPINQKIAIAEKTDKRYVKIDEEIKEFFQKWKDLLYLMRSRSSHVRELV